MSQDQILMYTEYFQTMRDYLVHLQSLTLLLLTACSYMYLKSQTRQAKIASGIAFFIGVVSLIVGLTAFNKVLNIILDLKVNPVKADLMQIGCYVWTQFILGLITLVVLIFCGVRGNYAK
jgi:hypothetical protein